MEKFKGKAIYNPSGKAGEYSYWAVNFYNGCSARCEYCYNRHGKAAKVLGANEPTLKKCLMTPGHAIGMFLKEAEQNMEDLQKHGLFFNFVSDPFLKETISLNSIAMRFCIANKVHVKALTKQTWWLDEFLIGSHTDTPYWNLREENIKKYLAIGFTLTGHDELEPGAASNEQRIDAMKRLHYAGFKTWASIEPIIDIDSSDEMISKIPGVANLVKIGIKSGDTLYADDFGRFCLHQAVISWASMLRHTKVYFKDSLLKRAMIGREELPSNCVTRDYNIFNENR